MNDHTLIAVAASNRPVFYFDNNAAGQIACDNYLSKLLKDYLDLPANKYVREIRRAQSNLAKYAFAQEYDTTSAAYKNWLRWYKTVTDLETSRYIFVRKNEDLVRSLPPLFIKITRCDKASVADRI